MRRLTTPFRSTMIVLALLLTVVALAPAATAATARTVSMTTTPPAAAVGSIVVVTGLVTHSPRGSTVQVQRRTGTHWTLVSTARTTRTGSYRTAVLLPTTVGTYLFRAVAPATSQLRAATSAIHRVFAGSKVTATIKAAPVKVAAGSSTTLSGIVKPFTSGLKVYLQRLAGTTWVSVASTTLSATGRYSKAVTTNSPTIYRVRVPRSGTRAPAISIGVYVDTTPVISTTALPGAILDTPYSTTLTAFGNPSGTWSASPLPTGLTLDTATGRISGTPTVVGDTQVAIGFTETANNGAAPGKVLGLHVGNQPPSITSTSLPDGTQRSAYTTTLTAAGSPAGTWTAAPLPAGLGLNATTGVISGTPTGSGDSQVTIGFTQTSTGLAAAPKVLSLHIAPRPVPVITTTSLANGAQLQAYSATLTVANSPAGTWAVAGLPAGYSLNKDTGEISAPFLNLAPAGDYPLTVSYLRTDDGVAAVQKQLSLHIG